MFTGIVQAVGRIRRREDCGQLVEILRAIGVRGPGECRGQETADDGEMDDPHGVCRTANVQDAAEVPGILPSLSDRG